MDGDDAALAPWLHRDLDAGLGQHLFGVGPGGDPLTNHGRPVGRSPANKMADFTWALATLEVQSMPRSAPPLTRRVAGTRSRPVKVAPM